VRPGAVSPVRGLRLVMGMDANRPPPPAPPRRKPWGWLVLAAMFTAFWLWSSSGAQPQRREIDYTTALEWIRANQVRDITVEDSNLIGTLAIPKVIDRELVFGFHTLAPKDDRIVGLLDEHHVAILVVQPKQPVLLQLLFAALPWVLIIGVWLWLSRRAQQMMVAGGGPLGGFLKRGRKFEQVAAPRVTFEDVAGLAAAKRDLQEIIEFLKAPNRFRKLGAKIPRGVLLVGPPGTGKTLLARAVAGEAAAPFYSITASEFVEMFVGVGAARVRELFQEAKRNAPSIVFIDEIDAVGRARGTGLGGGHDEREQTLNQLLSEMDGFEHDDLTIVMAATNRPDVLDSALLRPGRFDRRVVVDLPEAAARRAILVVHTKDKPLAADVELDQIAAATAGFSGADLANLANEAALGASRRAAASITRDDFNAAFDKIILGDPRETKLRPAEKQRVAVHESGHAVLAWATPEAEPLRRVSILPRGMTLGATQQVPPEDRHLHTRAELDARLFVLLGGFAAERVILGDISTGAEHDLREATRLASKMVAHYGMSDRLGPVHYDVHEEHPFLGQRIATDGGTSDATVHQIEHEARELLARALASATGAVELYRTQLDKLAAALIDHETLEKEELDTLLGPPIRPPNVVPIDAPMPPTSPV
jgi:cell division protease FtsH